MRLRVITYSILPRRSMMVVPIGPIGGTDGLREGGNKQRATRARDAGLWPKTPAAGTMIPIW